MRKRSLTREREPAPATLHVLRPLRREAGARPVIAGQGPRGAGVVVDLDRARARFGRCVAVDPDSPHGGNAA
jgi:hypothetical protein